MSSRGRPDRSSPPGGRQGRPRRRAAGCRRGSRRDRSASGGIRLTTIRSGSPRSSIARQDRPRDAIRVARRGRDEAAQVGRFDEPVGEDAGSHARASRCPEHRRRPGPRSNARVLHPAQTVQAGPRRTHRLPEPGDRQDGRGRGDPRGRSEDAGRARSAARDRVEDGALAGARRADQKDDERGIEEAARTRM